MKMFFAGVCLSPPKNSGLIAGQPVRICEVTHCGNVQWRVFGVEDTGAKARFITRKRAQLLSFFKEGGKCE